MGNSTWSLLSLQCFELLLLFPVIWTADKEDDDEEDEEAVEFIDDDNDKWEDWTTCKTGELADDEVNEDDVDDEMGVVVEVCRAEVGPL